MDGYRRYAVYWVPDAGSDLAEAGATWLGWDAEAGAERDHPDLPVDLVSITARPRKYGLHGTLKPPFHLAKGRSFWELDRAATNLAASLRPLSLTGLGPQALGQFLALIEDEPSADLSKLAARIVSELDAFRAPPDADELARRRARPLSERQEANLVKWGYPHVMDAFRFHVTLSGRLDKPVRETVLREAERYFAGVLPKPFSITAIALCGERADTRFEILKRYVLGTG